ncbi:MAG: septation protein SepH [Rothia sp. (in: high G+C Gram-positive bacteria)]|uniref:septation protein SepH n=1 Tax=Rothia sp. (in: high G+C Gram-positive bacteria) TaxID=1885016 RepID=UPI0026E079B4|nr:septation protein SepH [Rothia sp. (in: high G+C Gram-positive bacteria)]MDO5750814.1 septation protein SepH [Rothia sp. (in: high G+C Gram-positive bacteria)]
MLELRLLGVHDDGEHLVLENADGTRYALPIDAQLRTSIASARRVTARTTSGGSFGPRDIQTRLRQGASVEEIAAESGWDTERVRRYEWPIVAERAHIISAAQNVKIGHRESASGATQIPVSLAARIEEIAERFGFEHAAQDWQTRQLENGQWRVSVDIDFPEGVRPKLPHEAMFPARWSYNPANQGLYASNEAAYFLMGNSSDAVAVAAKKAPPVAEHKAPLLTTGGPRLEAPKREKPSLTEPLASEVSPSVSPSHNADARKLAELLERARAASKPAPVVEPEPEPEVFEAVLLDGGAQGEEPAEPTVIASPAVHAENHAAEGAREEVKAPAEQAVEPEPAVEPVTESAQTESAAEQVEAAPAPAEEKAPKPASKKNARKSVPQWDDIIFGGRK